MLANTSDSGDLRLVAGENKTINALVAAGDQVLLFDYRGTEFSPKPSGKAAGRWQDHDVLGAAAELRRLGAHEVVLAGGSLGGVAVLVAATTLKPAPAAVIGLSASGFGPTQTALQRSGADAKTAVAAIRAPLLFVVAQHDPSDATNSAHTLFRAARSKDKELLIVPGETHAFFDNDASGAKVRTRILAFIKAHTHG